MDSAKDRPRVLVSAASGHGSTTEIARVIGDTLADNGIAVDIVPPAVVDFIDDYDAVILGSAVYRGPLAQAGQGLRDPVPRLAGHPPVWLFSSGPLGGLPSESLDNYPVEVTRIPPGLPRLRPPSSPANSTPELCSVAQRTSIAAVPPRVPGDSRDWDTITEWAEGIAAVVTAL